MAGRGAGLVAGGAWGAIQTDARTPRVVGDAQVLAKSCKMVPVMLAGTLLHRKRYSVLEYLCMLMIGVGVGLFARKSSSTVTTKLASPNAPLGYFLCFVNMSFDGYTNAYQDEVIRRCLPACPPACRLACQGGRAGGGTAAAAAPAPAASPLPRPAQSPPLPHLPRTAAALLPAADQPQVPLQQPDPHDGLDEFLVGSLELVVRVFLGSLEASFACRFHNAPGRSIGHGVQSKAGCATRVWRIGAVVGVCRQHCARV